jgi:hypothetical protein
MDDVRRIADAVLYEGYVLWPYRRSALKNTRRWTFGGVYPRDHSRAHPDDAWAMQTECLVRGEPSEVRVRFLHVVHRQALAAGQPVDEVTVDGQRHLTWDEATERELGPGPIDVPAGEEFQPLGRDAGLMRSWRRLEGAVAAHTEPLRAGVLRLTVRIENTTPFEGGREDALAQTFCSCHTVIRAPGVISMTDPPADLAAAAAGCDNRGTWPVLVGDDTILSSPIILEDNPGIAPESPGDLFDGGEIDQLLTLNILALTDEEKEEMRASDPRARAILERTERLSPEELMALHGTIREVRR